MNRIEISGISQVPMIDPIDPAIKMGEPMIEISMSCAFPQAIRNWWMGVANGKCQLEVYSEKGGWQNCGKPADHVHHIEPESWSKAQTGHKPDESVGLPLCRTHHSGGSGDHGEPDFSFHPDMGQALQQYRQGDKNAFKNTAQAHVQAAQRGERHWNSDAGVDAYYTEKMTELGARFTAEHPDSPKPTVKHKSSSGSGGSGAGDDGIDWG